MDTYASDDKSKFDEKPIRTKCKAKADTIICECGLDTLFPFTLLNKNFVDHYCLCGKIIAKASSGQEAK